MKVAVKSATTSAMFVSKNLHPNARTFIVSAALFCIITAGILMSVFLTVKGKTLLGTIIGVTGMVAVYILSALNLTLDKEQIQNYTTF